MPRAARILSKEDILRAMKHTRSNRAAARYLAVTYFHYRQYAQLYKEGDRTLYEIHANPSGKGIPKLQRGVSHEPPLMDILEGRIPTEHYTPLKLKERIIYSGLIEEKCGRCGFRERRLLDSKIPLILHHKNRDRKDFRLENLEFLCYNCSFLYSVSPISEKQVIQMEEFIDLRVKDFDWELDEYQKEHLKELGLYTETKPGEEFISKG